MLDVAPLKLTALKRGLMEPPRFLVDCGMDRRLRQVATEGTEILNVGCGVNPIPAAVNIDIQEFPGVDAAFDFTQPWPLADCSFDKVTMFHCLEHVPPAMALTVVREACRVLRWNGLFIAEVPDIDGLCRELVQGNYGMMSGAIFGGWDAPPDSHKFGYTASSLGLLCHLAGFIRLLTKPGTDYHAQQMPTVRVEAVKVPTRQLKRSGDG